MHERATVAHHLLRWARRLRSAPAMVMLTLAAMTVATTTPALARPADESTTSPTPVVSDTAAVHTPPPAVTVGGDTGVNTPTGPTTTPHGSPPEITALIPGTQVATVANRSTQTPPSAPIGSGLTRAPPDGSALAA